MFKISYAPNPGQRDFHASPEIYKAMVGAFGSGKTATLCVEGTLLSIEHPGNVGLVARKSLPELRTTTMKRFFEFMPDAAIIKWNKSERELKVRTKGDKPSTVYFGPLDEIDRYKSLELGWFAIDEASETDLDMWLTLCGRLRCPGVPRYAGMLATNPTTTTHWIYKRFVEKPTKGYALFRSKTQDNAEHLPPGYIDQLRSNYPDDWQRRFLDGEFGIIQEGDPVYPDFKQSLHVMHVDHIPGRHILRGWDFGYHFPCVVFAEFDEVQRFRILDTVLGKDEDLDIFAQRVIRFSNEKWMGANFQDFCDPSGVQKKDSGKPSVQILNDLRVYPRFRSSRIEERNLEVRKLMRQMIDKEPAFQVNPCNSYLIEGFLGGYQYGKKKEGMMSEEPKKDGYFDHGQDALGYIVANTCMVQSQPGDDRDFDIPEPKWASVNIGAPHG